MPYLAHQRDGLQPSEKSAPPIFVFSLLTSYPACRFVRSSMALERFVSFCKSVWRYPQTPQSVDESTWYRSSCPAPRVTFFFLLSPNIFRHQSEPHRVPPFPSQPSPRPSTAKPLRFSINTCPINDSFASFPFPLRYKRASLISCRFLCCVAPFLTVKIHRGIALVITSFVKWRVFLRESFSLLANASMSVPSTVKCSSLNNPCCSISFSTPPEECFGNVALQSAGSFGQSPHGSS